jgi:hypothetical protein
MEGGDIMNGIQLTISGNERYCEEHGLFTTDGDVRTLHYEINLSSDRLMLLLAAMHLDMSEYVGAMWGLRLWNGLMSIDANVAEFGDMTFETVQYYLLQLKAIAEESIWREEMIVWI